MHNLSTNDLVCHEIRLRPQSEMGCDGQPLRFMSLCKLLLNGKESMYGLISNTNPRVYVKVCSIHISRQKCFSHVEDQIY